MRRSSPCVWAGTGRLAVDVMGMLPIKLEVGREGAVEDAEGDVRCREAVAGAATSAKSSAWSSRSDIVCFCRPTGPRLYPAQRHVCTHGRDKPGEALRFGGITR